jgi:pyruvate dehydrogenase E1 component
MHGGDESLGNPDVFYYLTLYNENYPMPALPETPGIAQGIVDGLYRFADAPAATHRATLLFSGSAHAAARAAAEVLHAQYDVGVELWSATSYKVLRDDALATERWNRLHPSNRGLTCRNASPRRSGSLRCWRNIQRSRRTTRYRAWSNHRKH